jgi:pentatricopeptide repeat protein
LISYNACISACEKAGQWLQALKLLHQLQGQKLQGDVIMSPGCSFFVAPRIQLVDDVSRKKGEHPKKWIRYPKKVQSQSI